MASSLHCFPINASDDNVTSSYSGNTSEVIPEISYGKPLHNFPLPTVYYVFYYGVFMPIAFAGNLLTCILIGKRLIWRNRVPDVMVGGLALNDFLTCVVVFTPSIFGEIFQSFPDSRRFCQFHAVTTIWYLYTTFAIIVLMSVDRWLALYKPFYYQARVTTLQMKLVIGALGAFCLLLGSIPLIFYPVMPRVGWYCAVAETHVINGTIEATVPDLFVILTMTFIITGMVVLLTFTGHIIFIMTRKKGFRHHGYQKENRFAKLMAVVAIVFLCTWIPSWVSMMLCLFLNNATICHQSQFWASRWVNIGVAFNPILYGLMKKAYRNEYRHLLYCFLYYILCCQIPKPKADKEVFGPGASYTIKDKCYPQPEAEDNPLSKNISPSRSDRSSTGSVTSDPSGDTASSLAERANTPRIPKKDIIKVAK